MTQPAFPRQASMGVVVLAGLFLIALWSSGMPHFMHEVRLLMGSGVSTSDYELATWGNSLIATATVLYLANLFIVLEYVGVAATLLTAAGAAVLVLDAGMRVFGVTGVSGSIDQPYIQQYNLISVVVPMVVSWYLMIERVNRDRSAGAFVMPVVLCLIGAEMWLAAASAGNPAVLFQGFHNYWGQAYVVAHLIGYGAFVLAGAFGLLYLVRYHLQRAGTYPAPVERWLPNSWRAQNIMLSALGIGVPVFGLALIFATGWGLGARWTAFAWFKGLWIGSVVAFYGRLLYVVYTRSMPGHRMAWWTVSGLALTLALFLGAHVLALGVSH